MHFKIRKNIIIYGLCVLCAFFGSCNRKLFNESDCLGKWEMLKDNRKSFILKKDGSVEFHNLRFRDMGFMEWESDATEHIPDRGSWEIETKDVYQINVRQSIIFWVKRDAKEIYGLGWELRKEGTGLELWFSVGDPDDYEWKRFRLVRPDPK